MAKTVSGMRGAGNKPYDRPATKTGGSMSGGGGSGGTSQYKAKTAPKEKKAAMAKPVKAPMVSPAPLSKSKEAEKTEDGDERVKTVFGMPAMKLPAGAAKKETQKAKEAIPYTQEEPLNPLGKTQALSATARGASVPAPPSDDSKFAYNETVLGMAAVRPESQPAPDPTPAPQPEKMDAADTYPADAPYDLPEDETPSPSESPEESSPAVESVVSPGESPPSAEPVSPEESIPLEKPKEPEISIGTDASWTGQVADVPMEQFTTGTEDGSIPASPLSASASARKNRGKRAVKIAVIVGLIAVVAIVLVLYIFGAFRSVAPKVPPTLPPGYNSAGAPGQQAPVAPVTPGAAQAPSMPGALPATPPSPPGNPGH
jgi:hypothetical protein